MKKSAGFTMIEVMIALGLSLGVAMAGLTVWKWAQSFFFSFQDRAEAEIMISEAVFHLREALSQAVDIRLNGGADLNTWTGTGSNTQGAIVMADFSAGYAAGPNDVTAVAVFNRETGRSHIATPGNEGESRMAATAIFFQRPQATRSGVIYMSSHTNTGGAQALDPSQNSVFFPRVTEFQTFNPQVADWDNNKMMTVDVRIRMRYHYGKAGGQPTWCPEADMTTDANCVTDLPSKDLERTFTVHFRNNDIQSPMIGSVDRVLGPLHFYKIYIPYNQQ